MPRPATITPTLAGAASIVVVEADFGGLLLGPGLIIITIIDRNHASQVGSRLQRPKRRWANPSP